MANNYETWEYLAKKKPKIYIEPLQESIIPQKHEIMERPHICCIDLDKGIISKLKEGNLNVYDGSFGSRIKIPNHRPFQNHQVLLKNDLPKNILEYDIFIIDLNNHSNTNYDQKDHIRELHTGLKATYLVSSYPETVFDPKPISSSILGSNLERIKQRKFFVIIFCSPNYSVTYQSAKTDGGELSFDKTHTYGIYPFPNVPISETSNGKEFIICDINKNMIYFFEKYLKGSSYHQTFNHPKKYDKNYSLIDDESFIPFIKNLNGEIVSYIQTHENMDLFMFPDIADKANFVNEFIFNIAPSIYPELFPYSAKSNWKEIDDYWLPNHLELITEKANLEEEFKLKLAENKSKIESNYVKYSFLHELLTETGDTLVKSIIKFLKWLDYKKVEDNDSKKSTILEEDIQVDISEGIIIIECKGIGGTSTDSDCNQISKIKHRRCRERQKFDVYALYIVNHQRHLPPLKRQNPPFSKEQIQDAINEERGLLTTWQLFNVYFEIEKGILSKEEAKKSLLKFGLIDFRPKDLIYIDEPKEFFDNGNVCIVNLVDINLKINDEIFIEKNGKFNKATIISIKENDKDISHASNGEFGIKLNSKIEKNTKLWKKAISIS